VKGEGGRAKQGRCQAGAAAAWAAAAGQQGRPPAAWATGRRAGARGGRRRGGRARGDGRRRRRRPSRAASPAAAARPATLRAPYPAPRPPPWRRPWQLHRAPRPPSAAWPAAPAGRADAARARARQSECGQDSAYQPGAINNPSQPPWHASAHIPCTPIHGQPPPTPSHLHDRLGAGQGAAPLVAAGAAAKRAPDPASDAAEAAARAQARRAGGHRLHGLRDASLRLRRVHRPHRHRSREVAAAALVRCDGFGRCLGAMGDKRKGHNGSAG
jgi:hypothetical protein